MIGTFGSSHSISLIHLDQATVLISAATRSVRASCSDPVSQAFLDNFKPTLDCLGGHLDIQGDSEPSPEVLGEQATMEKNTHNGFDAIASVLAELNAEGLSMQTVNDPLTMYVGAASQHVLRMGFVSEREATTFDTEVVAFRSQLIKRDATSTLFHLPLKLGGLGVGSAAQRHAASPCPHSHATTSRSTCSTSNHTLTTHEQACSPP